MNPLEAVHVITLLVLRIVEIAIVGIEERRRIEGKNAVGHDWRFFAVIAGDDVQERVITRAARRNQEQARPLNRPNGWDFCPIKAALSGCLTRRRGAGFFIWCRTWVTAHYAWSLKEWNGIPRNTS